MELERGLVVKRRHGWVLRSVNIAVCMYIQDSTNAAVVFFFLVPVECVCVCVCVCLLLLRLLLRLLLLVRLLLLLT